MRDFPRVYQGLVAKRLNMSTVALLQSVLDVENESELVAAALGKSQAEVEKLVAACRPAKSVRDRIVPMRMPQGETGPAQETPPPSVTESPTTGAPASVIRVRPEPVSPARVVPNPDSSSLAELGTRKRVPGWYSQRARSSRRRWRRSGHSSLENSGRERALGK